MLIVGAGGLAAQLYDDLVESGIPGIAFWSEIETMYGFIKEHYKILKTDSEVVDHFNNVSRSFILCIGNIENRKMLTQRFEKLGGIITTFISPGAIVSRYTTIGKGSLIFSRVEIEAMVIIGENCLVNKTANIGHGCVLGNNCEISPGVILTGEVILGDDCSVGTRAVVLPKVRIGNNVSIAPGSYVKKNVPDNAVVSGEFASIKFYRKT